MDLLEEGLHILGIYNGDKIEQLKKYITELELWNKKHNLVKVTGDQLILRHILDSLAPYHILKETEGDTIADIGSGAGLPGVPLAIWMDNRRFSLIEKMEKRCGFLRNVKAVCGIQNMEILPYPVEEIENHFSICVFRALGDFSVYIEKLKRIVAPGGIAAAYKGKRRVIQEELNEIDSAWRILNVKPVEVPFLHEERHLVLLQRI